MDSEETHRHVFFETFDEDWKGNNNDPNPNGAEKH